MHLSEDSSLAVPDSVDDTWNLALEHAFTRANRQQRETIRRLHRALNAPHLRTTTNRAAQRSDIIASVRGFLFQNGFGIDDHLLLEQMDVDLDGVDEQYEKQQTMHPVHLHTAAYTEADAGQSHLHLAADIALPEADHHTHHFNPEQQSTSMAAVA